MSAQIIDGKAIAQDIRNELKTRVRQLQAEAGITPGLAAVLVGDDPASRTYVNMKRKACAEAGIHSQEHTPPADISQDELLQLVDQLNNDPQIHGILIQLPLPAHIDSQAVLARMDLRKDVDGFHPASVGNLWVGRDCFVPCTPLGIMQLLERTGVVLKGKQATIVGRSNIVGKPVAALLLAQHATVTICHSRTADLPAECRRADVLVAAVGRARMIGGDWIKPGATVIDVGINRIEADGKHRLVGDVDYDSASAVAGAITPVPGGVGPMTIAMLLANTVAAAQKWVT